MSTSAAAARQAYDSRRDWRADAACRDVDPELFFPDGDIRSAWAQVKTAKLICRRCPVSATCLSWALADGQEAGIWGGLTEDERRRLHRAAASGQRRFTNRGKVMTRTLQERPGPPGSARNDPPPKPVGFLSAYPGYRSTAQLPPATRVRVRGSQIEVDRVQS